MTIGRALGSSDSGECPRAKAGTQPSATPSASLSFAYGLQKFAMGCRAATENPSAADGCVVSVSGGAGAAIRREGDRRSPAATLPPIQLVAERSPNTQSRARRRKQW